jgi:hypothetical protein
VGAAWGLRGGESCKGFGVLEEFEEMGVGVGESESIEAVAIYQLVFLKVETDSCLSEMDLAHSRSSSLIPCWIMN